jgi:hypothetical protein
MSRWTFAGPPNLIVITVRQIRLAGNPVLYVAHDGGEGGWQFLTGAHFDTADALLVTLKSMIEHDSSLAGLADLPIGWQARRDNRESEWQRGPQEVVPDGDSD